MPMFPPRIVLRPRGRPALKISWVRAVVVDLPLVPVIATTVLAFEYAKAISNSLKTGIFFSASRRKMSRSGLRPGLFTTKAHLRRRSLCPFHSHFMALGSPLRDFLRSARERESEPKTLNPFLARSLATDRPERPRPRTPASEPRRADCGSNP